MLVVSITDDGEGRTRLQNRPYFCVFKYAPEVKQKVWNEAENNYGRVRLARFAHAGLLRHALPISLLILRKKPTVLQSRGGRQRASVERRLGVVVGANCFTLTKTRNRKPY